MDDKEIDFNKGRLNKGNHKKDKLMKCPNCNKVYVNQKECEDCSVSKFNYDYILKPVVFLFLLIISLSFTQAALTDGLIGYWNLTNTIDSSKDPLVCQQYGVTFTTGKVENAGDFESSETDDIQCKERPPFDIANTTTYNFWLKLESLSARQTIFVKDIETGGGTTGYWHNIETSVTGCTTGYCLCDLAVGVERDCMDIPLATGSTYTMYTFVKNSTHMKWYMNGTLKETDTRTANYKLNNHNLSIGKLPNGAGQYALDGILDELGIWNRTLTQAEITQLYNGNTGCDAIANPSGCSAATTQTPTPTLTNTSNGYTNITFSVTGTSGTNYLLYQNGTNIQNFTSSPFTRTGLIENTRYGFKVKVYNSTYTTALSNFSALKEVWTKQSPPTLTLYTDITQLGDYTQLNPFVMHFNGTATNVGSTIFNCSVYSCGGGASCMIPTFLLDSNLNTNVTTDNVLNWTDWDGWALGTVNITLFCKNGYVNASLGRDFYVDSYAPYITYNQGVNNSVFYKNINTQLPYIIQFDDDSNNLYAVNTTLCSWTTTINSCAQQISVWHNEIAGDESRLINVTNALSSLPPAYSKYYIYSQAWDSHTSSLIDSFDIKDISTIDKAGVKIENEIEISSPTAEAITLEKNIDRYNFQLLLKEDTNKVEFDLKSTGNLTYLPNSEYLGHFVDFDNKKWIDFVTPNADNVEVTKIDDYNYKVYVNMKEEGTVFDKLGDLILGEDTELKAGDSITFESIGTLNYVNSYVYFNISNSSTVRVKDATTTANIQNYTIKIYNSGGLIQQKTITNYNASFNITSGTYNINITPTNTNYIKNTTLNVAFSPNLNKLIYVYPKNSFFITYKDEVTLAEVNNTNITLDIIGATYSNRFTTENGTMLLSLITPESYTFRYQASGYNPRLSTYTLTNNTFSYITLYLLTTGASNISLYVYDSTRNPIENAQIDVYRYNIYTNAYVFINSINTDYEGKVVTDLAKNSEFYKFYIYYDSNLKLATTPAYITSDTIVFTINLDTPILEQFYKNTANYTYSCDYNEITRNFKFYYQTNTEASAGCLYVYKLTSSGKTLVNTSCLSAATSSLMATVTNTSGVSYISYGYVTVNGNQEYLCSATTTFINNAFDKTSGNIIVILLLVLGAFLSVFSLPLSFILFPLGLVMGAALQIINIGLPVAIGIEILGIILALIISQKNRG